MDVERFTGITKKELRRGDLILVKTGKSDCVGYLEGSYPQAKVPFLVLAATKKHGQGREGEDWFDHTYSIPAERITSVEPIQAKH
jgi:hypothetical protein